MKFVKMHGCGNDYIVIPALRERIPNPSDLARTLCRRHFGIGGDGIIVIGPSLAADFKMEIYNPDGSAAQMCGNGLRCAARLVYEQNLLSSPRRSFRVESGGIIRSAALLFDGKNIRAVRVNMGKPQLTASRIPVRSDSETVIGVPLFVSGQTYSITCVSMGNPHCVIFTDDVSRIDLNAIGPALEHHSMFPERTNVEFVQIVHPALFKMRVWERGVGETLACGTGCCAALAAGVLQHFTRRECRAALPGGTLNLFWDEETGDLSLTGPAETVFEGEISL